MSIGRGYQEESATFDDVAMILLFFFLVMVFFAFNKKYLDLAEKKKQKSAVSEEQPRKIVELPKIRLVTHRPLDFLVHVTEDSSITITNLGGMPGLESWTIQADDDEEMTDYKTTERSEAAQAVRQQLLEMTKPGLTDTTEKARFYLGAHPDAFHGATYQAYAGFVMARHDLGKHLKAAGETGSGRIFRLPCPASAVDADLAEQFRTINLCVRQRINECGVSVAEAEKKGGECPQRIKLECHGDNPPDAKSFCNWNDFEKEGQESKPVPAGKDKK